MDARLDKLEKKLDAILSHHSIPHDPTSCKQRTHLAHHIANVSCSYLSDSMELPSAADESSIPPEAMHYGRATFKFVTSCIGHQLGWWNTSYVLDYVAGMIAIMGIAFLNDGDIITQRRWYPEPDQWEYNQIERSQTVPWVTEVLPWTISCLVLVCFLANIRRPSLHDIHNFLLTCLTGFFAYTWIYLVARSFGRPRPMFLSECDPEYVIEHGTTYIRRCTNPDYDEWNWASMVSGHMCFPTTMFTIIILYIIGKANPWRNGGLAFVYVLFFPMCTWCAWIGFSRVWDNVHHYSDVLNSALIGVLNGFLSYLLYYPMPFADLRCNPHQPRLRAGTYRNPGPTNLLNYLLVNWDSQEKLRQGGQGVGPCKSCWDAQWDLPQLFPVSDESKSKETSSDLEGL